MAKEPMPDHIFERLLADINQETHLVGNKIEILFRSRGFFSASQASRLLYAFSNSTDRLRATQVLESRLCRMTCSEARDIIGTFTIANDKIKALNSIKRYLRDVDTREGQEDIMAIFPFGMEEVQRVLYTARSDQADLIPAGGHQGYAALGGLYTQSRPLVPHLYGSVEEQNKQRPGVGRIEIPVEAKAATLPSVYSGHPSYAYPPGKTYADDRGYMTQAPQVAPSLLEYPAGAPPLGVHQGGPTPTGFQIYRSILSE